MLTDAWRPIGEEFDHDAAAARCVEMGLFEDRDDAYFVHDYLEFNPTRDDAKEAKRKNAERQKRYRDDRKNKSVTRYETRDTTRDETSNETRFRSATASTVRNATPVPSRPVPSRHEEAAAAVPELEPESGERSSLDLPLTTDQVSGEWHRVLRGPGGCITALHAEHRWRADYETIACAVNTLAPRWRMVGLRAVCEWFWHAPDGPIRAGRIEPRNANPGQLAKNITRDLHAANEWWQAKQAQEVQAS